MKVRADSKRIRDIAAVFLKYGMKEGVTSLTNPRHLRMALEELGPTFVKIGQLLSTRPDIMPDAFIQEFQKLQDAVKPVGFDVMKAQAEKELRKPLEEVFKSFEETPVASASLAQVYRAVLISGENVVVKLQRPGIKQTIVSDLRILKRLAIFIKFTPQGQVLDPVETLDELSRVLTAELDFMKEAENLKKFRSLNGGEEYIVCPGVFEEYTSGGILVMEYIDGIKIADLDQLEKNGYDLEDLAVKLTNNYLKQLFADGFFHGDPHPGNIMVTNGKIAYIDLGMMGTLENNLKRQLNRFLHGMTTRNVELMSRSLVRLGVKKGNVSPRKLRSDVEQIYNEYVEESLYDIDVPKLLDELFRACRRNNIALPREITMFVKGLMTIEGVVLRLAPDLNIMDLTIPYLKRHMASQFNLSKEFAEQLENLYSLSKTGLKLPVSILELVNSALAGKLKVQMEHTNLEESIGELNKMVNRLVFGIIVAALIVGSSLVLKADTGPKMLNVSAIGLIGFIGTALLGIFLLFSILRSGKM